MIQLEHEDETTRNFRQAASERRALLVELANFDTTRFPGMEAEAVRQAEKFGLDPIDLLLACESIFKAGLGEIAGE